jgi:hypothetical protein
MMRPSITVSVFSYSQIWIRALVCKNLKIRFCAERKRMAGKGGGGKVSILCVCVTEPPTLAVLCARSNNGLGRGRPRHAASGRRVGGDSQLAAS